MASESVFATTRPWWGKEGKQLRKKEKIRYLEEEVREYRGFLEAGRVTERRNRAHIKALEDQVDSLAEACANYVKIIARLDAKVQVPLGEHRRPRSRSQGKG